jgi:hypothetical protein
MIIYYAIVIEEGEADVRLEEQYQGDLTLFAKSAIQRLSVNRSEDMDVLEEHWVNDAYPQTLNFQLDDDSMLILGHQRIEVE